MPDTPSATRILIRHFFRRFFDNDTLQADGDTQTTVIRAISTVAAPGLMIAFFLQNQYPYRPAWGAIEDQYFFVLFTFVVMGIVSIFEWEMLFPDRLDFLILSPLSLRPLQMFAAKAIALAAFLALFLIGSSLFGDILLPAVSHDDFFRHLAVHTAAVFLAGAFSSLFFVALGGVLLCILGSATFRLVSPLIQTVSVAALCILLIHYPLYGDSIQSLLTPPLGIARFMPPLWFLGLYEYLHHGAHALPFAEPLAHMALRATAITAAVAVVTYPIAWARMRRRAMEGESTRRTQPSPWPARITNLVVRRPGERAVFRFIGQTLARNNRYQVYLAMYCGAGLALAVACSVTFRQHAGAFAPALSTRGLHAVLPLLLFWTIAGLRTAFGFPIHLAAGWIFRITGVPMRECATAAHRWVLLCATAVTALVLAALWLLHFDARQLAVQAVCGAALSVFLTDAFFAFQQSVPFNRPRMPGRASLPLMLTLYVGVLPPFIFGMVNFTLALEKHPAKLLIPVLVIALFRAALALLYRPSTQTEEDLEGYEGEFQLLGLS